MLRLKFNVRNIHGGSPGTLHKNQVGNVLQLYLSVKKTLTADEWNEGQVDVFTF